jgi:hypothetical protein
MTRLPCLTATPTLQDERENLPVTLDVTLRSTSASWTGMRL